MQENKCSMSAARLLMTVFGGAALGYAAFAGYKWTRFGRPDRPLPDEADDLLNAFMPAYDVVERHHVHVDAPAETTLAAAEEQDLIGSLAVRAIFWLRELVMGSRMGERELPRGLVAQAEALGWGVLARVPGREVVFGAVTKPWEADVTFQPLQPAEFSTFEEPGYVKIIWTLRADPVGPSRSIFRTETRAVATDAEAWHRFRRYWAAVSPGVELMRRLSLTPVKKEAELRAQEGAPVG